MSAALRVTVEDLETGDTETQEIPLNEVLIITTGTCYVDGWQDYPGKGTTVYTIKGRGGRS